MSTADDELWTLTFLVQPGPTPSAARVRRVLKIARGYGLVCVRVEEPLPELTDEERAAMISHLPPDFVDRILRGERPIQRRVINDRPEGK